MYVVVNMSNTTPFKGRYIIGEDAVAELDLGAAIDVLIDAMVEYEHDLVSAQIFELVPVPVKNVRDAVKSTLEAGRLDELVESYGEEIVAELNDILVRGG